MAAVTCVKDVLDFMDQMIYYQSYQYCLMVLGLPRSNWDGWLNTPARKMIKTYIKAIKQVWTNDGWIHYWAKPYETVVFGIPKTHPQLRKQFSKEQNENQE